MLITFASPLANRAFSDNSLYTQTVTLDEAQKHLPELVHRLANEGELLITDADKPVARLAPVSSHTSLRHLKSSSLGAVLRPFPEPNDDLLDEMLHPAK